MLTFDPRDSLGFHCSITFRAFARELERTLSDTGISPAQFIALAHLTAFGAMPQAELAAHLSTSPVSIVKLIDRMERDGWVQRQTHEQDRRIKMLVPTDQAAAVWRKLTRHANQVIEKAYKGIPEEDIQKVKTILESIRKNLMS